jgi:DNA-binding MarR family transcriptional regulator
VAPNATELETAPRLRGVIGKLARLLRRTDALGHDLTPTRVAVLLTTDRHGPLRLAEVAEREGLNPTLLSRTIAELISDQLVTRTSDPEDRRSAWVQVTETGHALAEQVRAERTAAVQGAVDDLDAADRTLIDAALPALERLAQTLAEGSPTQDARRPSGSPIQEERRPNGSPGQDEPR